MLAEDVQLALSMSVSEALCVAATSSPFLPDACAEAAKAHKHAAFADRIVRATEAQGRVSSALRAAAGLLQATLAERPAATVFIDSAGVAYKPRLVMPPEAKRPELHGPKGVVSSRLAPAMMRLWVLKHGLSHFGYSACAKIPEGASHERIAASLAGALQSTATVADEILRAYQETVNASGPSPAKRARLG